jgi:hypothetical protein
MTEHIDRYMKGYTKGYRYGSGKLAEVEGELATSKILLTKVAKKLTDQVEWIEEAVDLMAETKQYLGESIPLLKVTPKTMDGKAMYPGLTVFWKYKMAQDVICLKVTSWNHAVSLEKEGDIYGTYLAADES